MTEDTTDSVNSEAWYAIPLTQLGLHASTVERLRAADIDNVGDLVDLASLLTYATVSMPSEMLAIMAGEVREKLREHGYWPYEDR